MIITNSNLITTYSSATSFTGNSDFENNVATPSSPTSQLLQEYEMHLRNTLAKGMDAESYSLHTFEALLTQSMENLGRIILNFYILIYYLNYRQRWNIVP